MPPKPKNKKSTGKVMSVAGNDVSVSSTSEVVVSELDIKLSDTVASVFPLIDNSFSSPADARYFSAPSNTASNTSQESITASSINIEELSPQLQCEPQPDRAMVQVITAVDDLDMEASSSERQISLLDPSEDPSMLHVIQGSVTVVSDSISPFRYSPMQVLDKEENTSIITTTTSGEVPLTSETAQTGSDTSDETQVAAQWADSPDTMSVAGDRSILNAVHIILVGLYSRVLGTKTVKVFEVTHKTPNLTSPLTLASFVMMIFDVAKAIMTRILSFGPVTLIVKCISSVVDFYMWLFFLPYNLALALKRVVTACVFVIYVTVIQTIVRILRILPGGFDKLFYVDNIVVEPLRQ